MIEDFVTKSIIVSKNLEFRAPQDIVVTNKIDFCSITAINLESKNYVDFISKPEINESTTYAYLQS